MPQNEDFQFGLSSALVIRQPTPTLLHQVCALHGRETVMMKLALLLTRFRKELLLAWAILRDGRTPAAAKLATIAAVLYVISPVDFIPDLIPILGWLDDGILALLFPKLAKRLLPADLLASLEEKIGKRKGVVDI
jgi:uncharacterized membrane protein YkvA (DUF1232 family)